MSLTSYKKFLEGISVVPKSTTGSSKLGEVETLTSTNKLYFHNGTINDPIVQENVQATLSNKTLNLPLANTITGITGVDLSLQSSAGQKVLVENFNFDNNTLSSTGNININSTLGNNTYFQVTGTNVVRVDADGIAFLTQDQAKFYDADNSNYVGINAPATVPVDYTITLPSAAPTANTALVWDGTAYKWGAAGGADSSGANDDILATAFRARILDSFDDAPSLSSSTINSATTTATHVPANQLYSIQYSNTTISSANTTTPSLAASPGFLAVGDVIIVGTEVRRVTALSPLTIESAFSVASGSCTVSQTVSSKELYGSAFDGASISSAFGGSSFSEYLVDYQDSVNTIFTPNINPLIAYSASQDAITWSALATRPINQTDQIQSATFASPSTGLYVRLFANVTVGSGTVNLLEYRAYMQKSPTVSSGVLNTAYARLDGSTTPQNCSLSTVGGKTRVTLTWPYSNSVNNPSAYGAIDVYVNGQFIPRQVGSYLTTGAFYTEISNTVIELDTNYSATPYAIQVVQRQPMGNFTSSSGGSSSTAGSGLKNYLTTYGNNPGNGNFETGDTSGWGLFNTTLTSLIPTGAITSGASSISTFSATATTPLAGTYSLLVGTSTGFTAGQGFISNVFTIDREDRAKVLTFNFSYEVISGTGMNFSGTSSNTWAVYIHDGTSWIQPAGVYGMVQSSGTGYVTGTFQTGATATQYRLAVVCINAPSAGTYTLEFDDFFVGPQVSVNAPAMSDWQSYTLTIGATTTAPTPGAGATSSARWRRTGDSIELIYTFSQTVAGSVGSGTYLFPLPSGLSIDTNKVVTTTTPNGLSGTVLGISTIGTTTANNTQYATPGSVFAYNSTNLMLSANSAASIVNAMFAVGSGAYTLGAAGSTYYTFTATIPIAGWSSNTVASNDTDTRVVAARATKSANQNIATTAATVITWNTYTIDTHGGFSGNTYTIPVSGYYRINLTVDAFGITSGATGYCNIPILRNGNILQNYYFYTSNNEGIASNAGVFLLSAGDQITATAASPDGNYDLRSTNTFISIERLSGPAVVQASESVNASYWVTTTATVSAGNPFNFDGKDWDTHNAVTTGASWKFTAPISGKYMVTGYINPNSNPASAMSFLMRKNGVFYQAVQSMSATAAYGAFSSTVALNAGEYIDIRPDTAYSIYGNASRSAQVSYIQITRIGN